MSPKLDDCGCCEELSSTVQHDNPPGLDALAYRLGTHASFLARMKARLTTATLADGDNAGQRPLRGLSARDTSDPTIALLDAFASMADVITFYQERIANEAFIGTATERRSVLELARAIGYELDPGVAAQAWLELHLDEAASSPDTVQITRGNLAALSVPGQDERPQHFEPVEDFTAHVGWNAIPALLDEPQDLATGEDADELELWLDGLDTKLRLGDRLLLVRTDWTEDNPDDSTLVVVTDLEQYPELGLTRVSLGGAVPTDLQGVAASQVQVYAMRGHARLYGATAQPWAMLDEDAKARIRAVADSTITWDAIEEWPAIHLFEQAFEGEDPPGQPTLDLEREFDGIATGSWAVVTWPGATFVTRIGPVSTVGRQDMGYAAQVSRIGLSPVLKGEDLELRDIRVDLLADELTLARRPLLDAAGHRLPVYGDSLELGEVDLRLAADRPVVITGRPVGATDPKDRVSAVATVELLVEEEERGSTLLYLDQVLADPRGPGLSEHQATLSWDWSSEELSLAVEGDLAEVEEGLRLVAMAILDGAEVWLSARIDVVGDYDLASATTVLYLDELRVSGVAQDDLDGMELTVYLGALVMDRETVSANANVVLVTHGETVQAEVLGSGETRTAVQSFELKKPPLTYEPAGTAAGRASTLDVRVNQVLWQQVSTLYGQEPDAQVYMVRHEDDGTVRVMFGDGQRGARLPTGAGNIQATYRSGIGLSGQVGAGKLVLPKKRPLGVQTLRNPEPAFGAEDPETMDSARQAAPSSIQTIERIVSVRDYQDYARTTPGIGKARSTRLWDGEREVVHVTVGSSDGQPATADQLDQLASSLFQAGDPSIRDVVVQAFDDLRVQLWLEIVCDPAWQPDTVLAAVEARLVDQLAFEHRAFSEPLTRSQVIALAHGTDGVVSVLLRGMRTVQTEAEASEWVVLAQSGELPADPVPERLSAAGAAVDPDASGAARYLPAQLLLLYAGDAGIIVTEASASEVGS